MIMITRECEYGLLFFSLSSSVCVCVCVCRGWMGVSICKQL